MKTSQDSTKKLPKPSIWATFVSLDLFQTWLVRPEDSMKERNFLEILLATFGGLYIEKLWKTWEILNLSNCKNLTYFPFASPTATPEWDQNMVSHRKPQGGSTSQRTLALRQCSTHHAAVITCQSKIDMDAKGEQMCESSVLWQISCQLMVWWHRLMIVSFWMDKKIKKAAQCNRNRTDMDKRTASYNISWLLSQHLLLRELWQLIG